MKIVVKFPRGTSLEQAKQFAKDANCTVLRPIAYAPYFYVLGTTAKTTKSRDVVAPKYQPPTPEVVAAVAKLSQTPGVYAGPNYYRFVDGVIPTASNSTRRAEARARLFSPVVNQPPTKAKHTRQTVEPSTTVLTPNDPLYEQYQAWHMSAIRMPEAWTIQANAIGRVVTVAVIDTGLDVNHPDFKRNGVSNIQNPQSFAADPANPVADVTDGNGHGTHVAGTVAAQTNNSVGVVGVAGYDGGGVVVHIVPVQALGADGSGSSDSVIGSLEYALTQNVDVVNLSLGSTGASAAERQAVGDLLNAGVVVVAAAGNISENAPDPTQPIYPGSYPGVIRVSSVGRELTLAAYSFYGSGITIAAPGGNPQTATDAPEQVFSTWASGAADEGSAVTSGGAKYEGIQGTSMASPHVAGVCALLIAAGCPKSEVYTTIQQTALQLDETPVYDGSFSKYGAGLIDAYSALYKFSDPAFTVNLIGDLDLGSSFTSDVPAVIIQAIGVTKAPPVGTVTIEIQTATYPASVVRRLVEGRDFTIPRTLTADQRKGTVFNITAPGTGNLATLPPGRYKIVLKQGEVVKTTQFTEVLSHTQPQGRTMFASPFLTRTVNAAQPEQAVLGADVVYSLARYNSFRTATDFDYALFQSAQGGRRDTASSFSAALPDGSPLSYQVTDRSTSIAPVGLGYWLDLDRTVTLNPVGATVDNSVGVRLSASNSGWNQVGAPFTGGAAWGGCSIEYNGTLYSLSDAISRGYVGSALIGYSNGDYNYALFPFGTLEPFNGYWVRAFVDCTLIIPPAGITRSVKTLTPTARNSAALAPVAIASHVPGQTGLPKVDGWRGRLSAYIAGDRDGQNYFGQSRSVKVGGVDQDVPKPPSGAGHAYVHFEKSESGRSATLAFDMRPISGKQEWTAVVSTDKANSDVTLGWDTLTGVPRSSRLTLTDTVTGKTVDMRSRSSYTFRSGEAGSTHRVKITVQPGSSRGLLALTGVTVVPSGRGVGGGVAVRYQTTDDADVTAVVKSVTGKEVAIFEGQTRAVAGVANTLRWNGRLKDGTPVAPGTYIVVIEARGTNGERATYSQPVQSLQ